MSRDPPSRLREAQRWAAFVEKVSETNATNFEQAILYFHAIWEYSWLPKQISGNIRFRTCSICAKLRCHHPLSMSYDMSAMSKLTTSTVWRTTHAHWQLYERESVEDPPSTHLLCMRVRSRCSNKHTTSRNSSSSALQGDVFGFAYTR